MLFLSQQLGCRVSEHLALGLAPSLPSCPLLLLLFLLPLHGIPGDRIPVIEHERTVLPQIINLSADYNSARVLSVCQRAGRFACGSQILFSEFSMIVNNSVIF